MTGEAILGVVMVPMTVCRELTGVAWVSGENASLILSSAL
jgi:hypothetical protein